MKVTVELNKRRPESIEEVGVYMQGLEEGVKETVKVLAEVLENQSKPRRKRRFI